MKWFRNLAPIVRIAIIIGSVYIILTICYLLLATRQGADSDKYLQSVYSLAGNVMLAIFFTLFLSRHNQTKSKKRDLVSSHIAKFSDVFNRSFSVSGVITENLFQNLREMNILLSLLEELMSAVCCKGTNSEFQVLNESYNNIDTLLAKSPANIILPDDFDEYARHYGIVVNYIALLSVHIFNEN